MTNAPIPTILPPTTTIEPLDDTSKDTTPRPATFVSTRSASCDGTGTAPYDLRTVEIGATPTGAAIAIEYAPIEPRHAVAVTVVAGDDRHQVVAELFEDGTFVVRLQDLVASDSEFVGGNQVVDDQGMQIEVPGSTLDTATLTGATAVELVVDGVLVETCRLD